MDSRPAPTERPPAIRPRRLVPFLLLSMLALSLSSMVRKNAAYDEIAHIAAGYSYVTRGDFRMNTEHPVVVKLLAGGAVATLRPGVPTQAEAYWEKHGRWAEWLFGWHFLYSDPNDMPPQRADRVLLAGRIPILALGLLTALMVYRWASIRHGPGAGIFALILCVFSPDILAHSQIVTTDLGITFFWLASLYAVFRALQTSRPLWIGLAGVAAGLALATKFSGAIMMAWLVPLIALWVFYPQRICPPPATRADHGATPSGPGDDGAIRPRMQKPGRRAVAALGASLAAGLLAWGTVWAAYGFRYSASPGGVRLPAERWVEALPEKGAGRVVIQWLRAHEVLPEAYLNGAANVARMRTGRTAYLMGEFSRDGWLHYFAVTFLIKTPVALLVFAAAALALFLRRRGPWLTPAFFLVCPLVMIFVFSSASRLNIGHRHILPVYPLLFILVSGLWKAAEGGRPVWRWLLGALTAWYVGASVFIFPDYLAYFNELIGGPRNGYKYLLDSNLDWGQDLKQLSWYLEDHRIEDVKLNYFGTAPPSYYGVHARLLPRFGTRDVQPPQHPEWLKREGVFAVSANMYAGLLNQMIQVEGAAGSAEPLSSGFYKEVLGRDRKPDDMVGYSILIFDFRNQAASR